MKKTEDKTTQELLEEIREYRKEIEYLVLNPQWLLGVKEKENDIKY